MKNYQKCLYGNLVSINFRKTAVLKKQTNKQSQTLASQQRIVVTNLGGHTCAEFLRSLALDFPYICLSLPWKF